MKRLLALAILLIPSVGIAEVPFNSGFGFCYETAASKYEATYKTFEDAGIPKPSKKLADYIKEKECTIVVSVEGIEEDCVIMTYSVMCKEECGWKQAGRHVVIGDWHNEEGE